MTWADILHGAKSSLDWRSLAGASHVPGILRDMDTEPIEKRTAAGPIAIYLSPDEALVLDAYLSRASKANDYGSIDDQAELRVLWDLGAILESWLVPTLQPDYPEHLVRARAAVRDSTE